MQYSEGICSSCGKSRLIVKPSKKLCHPCNQERLNEGKEKKIYSIPKESAKRKKENKEYEKARKEYLSLNPMCEANVIDFDGTYICKGRATEIHHLAGKIGKLLYDKTNFLAVDRECHKWIELNPIEAKKRGFSRSRLESKQEIIPLEE